MKGRNKKKNRKRTDKRKFEVKTVILMQKGQK
jgi:hypothetical protein